MSSPRGFMLGATLLLWHLPGASLERIEGVALRLPEQIEVYREHHTSDVHSQHIEYRTPDGRLIAEQSLDYACSQAAPTFEQRDLRHGTRLGARWDKGVYLLMRDGKSRALPQPDRLVASSGFNRFVQAEWEVLHDGRPIEFDFALPARLQTFRLRIQRTEKSGTQAQANVWFRITAAQAWLRPFVAPIVLGYDEYRRLRIYRGLSNLEDSDGSTLNVEISYRYEASPPATPKGALAGNEPITAGQRKPDSVACGERRS